MTRNWMKRGTTPESMTSWIGGLRSKTKCKHCAHTHLLAYQWKEVFGTAWCTQVAFECCPNKHQISNSGVQPAVATPSTEARYAQAERASRTKNTCPLLNIRVDFLIATGRNK